MDSGLVTLKQIIESVVEGMSAEQLSWHPPGKWCAAEVLEHLYLTYTGTIKGFERVIEAGKPMATRRSLKQGWGTLIVVGLGHLPTGRKAPRTTEPRGLQPEKVRNEIGNKIVAMDAIIAECEARFGRSNRLLDHPVLGPLTGAQWRKFHLVHGRHHVKQLHKLREDMNAIGSGAVSGR
jgi:hypothetical protein